MKKLLGTISKCIECDSLPLGPRPIVRAHPKSKIIIIGQAPGTVVHRTGIPWDDKSGENLRRWMEIDKSIFYDSERIALIPMGFCYPGKGKSGDLPPRKECAPLWHAKIINKIENPELILLIGQYAQNYYLGTKAKRTLTDTVFQFEDYLPQYFVLPHPSPRNNIWQAKNEWFEKDVLNKLKIKVKEILK